MAYDGNIGVGESRRLDICISIVQTLEELTSGSQHRIHNINARNHGWDDGAYNTDWHGWSARGSVVIGDEVNTRGLY